LKVQNKTKNPLHFTSAKEGIWLLSILNFSPKLNPKSVCLYSSK